jgi:DNA-binding transcriptional ArsR family regulator
MADKARFNHCAEMLSALAAPQRLRIVRLLRDGPKSVGDLAAELRISLVNVSHHLTVLRHAGLVRKERRGRFILYSLPPGTLEGDADHSGIEHINLGCCRLELPCPEE